MNTAEMILESTYNNGFLHGAAYMAEQAAENDNSLGMWLGGLICGGVIVGYIWFLREVLREDNQ